MMSEPEAEGPRRSRLARGLLAGLVLALIVGAGWLFPGTDGLMKWLEWFPTAGARGWLGFGVLYLFVTLTLLPTSVLTMSGGFLFGPVQGFFVVWFSENLAAFACYLIGRYAARPSVQRMVDRSPLLTALDGAMRHRGFSLLVLIRHSPLVPFGILNYSMGLTAIRPIPYVLATLAGTAVPAFAYVYIGSTFTVLTDVLQGKPNTGGPSTWLYWLGLVATVVATIAVTWFTRRALNERLEAAGVPTPKKG